MTGWRPFHRRSPQRFTLDQLGEVFLTACSLVLLVVAASRDWCVSQSIMMCVTTLSNYVRNDWDVYEIVFVTYRRHAVA
jgi:hypothetical protein